VLAEVLFWGLLFAVGVTFGSLSLTKELRRRTDARSRLRTKAVVLLVVAAFSIAGAGLILGSRPEDHSSLLISTLFAIPVLIRTADLVAQWGIADEPSLEERVIRNLMRRQAGG
jgi:hypothetical protein